MSCGPWNAMLQHYIMCINQMNVVRWMDVVCIVCGILYNCCSLGIYRCRDMGLRML